MLDNRSAGFFGIGGSFNFKSGDPSGTAAKMSQEKYFLTLLKKGKKCKKIIQENNFNTYFISVASKDYNISSTIFI